MDSIKILALNLQDASKNELNLTVKMHEISKLKLEIIEEQKKYSKIHERFSYM
jgi:hypothetical protein